MSEHFAKTKRSVSNRGVCIIEVSVCRGVQLYIIERCPRHIHVVEVLYYRVVRNRGVCNTCREVSVIEVSVIWRCPYYRGVHIIEVSTI